MISVLIPTYNYDISALLQTVHKQLKASLVDFEIIILEDGSTTYINTSLNLTNTQVLINKSNLGRVSARQFLASKAQYNWLLFLDADVLPKKSSFIHDYILQTKLGYDAIFGGFAYYKDKPKKNYVLRWKYGKTKEQVSSVKRNHNPYKVIISANYLIRKSIFETINTKMNGKGYGYDNYFGALLKQHCIKVLHTDNEVYHLGIEKSKDYLKKKEQAAETLIHLYNSNTITAHSNDLLLLYLKLKRYHLISFFSSLYKLLKPIMCLNLTSDRPLIGVLQFYKISYMCYTSKKVNSL